MQTDLTFQQAKDELRAFLKTEERPNAVQWIFREDVMLFKRNILLRWPLPTDNELFAEKLFCQGKDKGLGLALEVYGFDQTNAFAYVLVPADYAESEAMMMTDLKLKYFTDGRRIIKIRPAIVWWAIEKLLSNRAAFWAEELIPLRNSI